jgi:hypothetical protein
MKTIQLIGYHDNMVLDNFTDIYIIYLCIMMLHVYNYNIYIIIVS